MRNQLTARVRLFGWALTELVFTAGSLVVFICTIAGAGLVIIWVGVPILVVTITVARWLAERRRAHLRAMLGLVIDTPYLRAPGGSPVARIAGLADDPAVRRDMLWLVVDATVGLTLSLLEIVEGVLDLIFWWLPPGLVARGHARLDYALLAVTEKSRLALRVQQLTDSRAETVDTQAAELRRIERDLHDGAQARLVALGMNLALAEEQLTQDPEGTRALLGEARNSSSKALAELRELVRGIHPPVLADRGLVGAVQALALGAPIPVEVQSQLPTRLPDPVESAAYFAVAEALTNVIKHADAAHAWVELGRSGDTLAIRVSDDGRGGADPSLGTGLLGIQRRLAAFDGTVGIESPPGGPTVVAMVLPCASSSPKTLPSSGTD